MIKTFFIGIFVGIANVIPGVSGGTLIVVFNIYEKFVNAITFNVKKLLQNWKFVVPVLLGMLSGILIFSKIITILYNKAPDQTNFFFTGLLIGSIPLLVRYVLKKEDKNYSKSFIAGVVLFTLLGIAAVIAFSVLQNYSGAETEKTLAVLPAWTVSLAVKIFIGGILGAVAMIIPGISGSLIMLILGIYPIIITSIPALFVKSTAMHALFLLLPNGIGVLIGLLAGAKLISLLLKKAPNQTYAVLLGLIVGSIFTMWPRSFNHEILSLVTSVLSLLLGVAMSYFSSRLSFESELDN